MNIGVLFPGQGAQTVGMGSELFSARPDLLGASADAVLGWSLEDVCLQGPEETLTLTQHAQPALYALSYGLWEAFSSGMPGGVSVAAAAGHSLGEYTALAAAHAVSFSDGLRLVSRRGEAMGVAAGVEPSAMAALIGADEAKAETLCADRRQQGGRLWVANLNAPGQVVVAGGVEDIRWAGEVVKEFGMRRAIPLKVAGAFHTPFMAAAVEDLRQAVDETEFQTPVFDVYANTSAAVYPADVGATLLDQVVGQVRFQALLENMGQTVEALVHIGPGDVTAGMAKRSVPDVPVFTVNNEATMQETFQALTELSTTREPS